MRFAVNLPPFAPPATLVELAVDGAPSVDVEPFRADRPILSEERPARSYMV